MYFNANCSSRLSIVVLVISPLIPEPCVAFGGAKLGVIEGVEGFRAEINMVPFEGQGEAPVDGEGHRIVHRRRYS